MLIRQPFGLLTSSIDSFGDAPTGEFQGFQVAVPAVPGVEQIRVVKADRTLGELNRSRTPSASLSPQAALEGSREKFVQALVLDGAVAGVGVAEKLADDLLAAQAKHLPWVK